MSAPPERPRIYHITHVDNLPGILAEGAVCSDRVLVDRGGPQQAIGLSDIKKRRLEQLQVPCHPGTTVGEYVPFYFCPRSVMLYVIYRGNSPELEYRGGQGPIVHLEADLHTVVEWAERNECRWALSLSNAGARYCQFRSRLESLAELDWPAIADTDFRLAAVKERKQAEFLVFGRFPFHLVERIGVRSEATRLKVEQVLSGAPSKPAVEVRTEWYFG